MPNSSSARSAVNFSQLALIFDRQATDWPDWTYIYRSAVDGICGSHAGELGGNHAESGVGNHKGCAQPQEIPDNRPVNTFPLSVRI